MRVRFGSCVFDSEARELRRAGAVVALSPRAFQLLALLVESRPRAVPQSELKDRLWPDSCVGRTSLARLITEIRKTTGDSGGKPRLIRTHHGFGYSFCGAVETGPDPEPAAPWRLVWGAREIPLGEGEHVIGRAPDCAMRVDTPRVSRHHARIVVRGDAAVLEDLGSKNGTYLRARRLQGPTPLAEGDEIAIGDAVLIFLGPPGADSTKSA